MSYATARHRDTNGESNKLYAEDRPVHEWYRFVLSFPPHLVRDYLQRFDVGPSQRVLDPFCGTGTTLVEAKKLAIASVGVEFNLMPCFASRVKTDWTPDPVGLEEHARRVADAAFDELQRQGIGDDVDLSRVNGHHELLSLPAERLALLLGDSISPLPLHKLEDQKGEETEG